MNIILDLDDEQLALLRGKLNTKPVDESLIIKFEQAIDNGIDGLLNWVEIDKDAPDGVTFGKFSDRMFKGSTHYFKPIEAEK